LTGINNYWIKVVTIDNGCVDCEAPLYPTINFKTNNVSVFCGLTGSQCELVANSDFEAYTGNCSLFSWNGHAGNGLNACDWFSVQPVGPDYYTSCAPNFPLNFSVNSNLSFSSNNIGSMAAHSGDGYAGLYAYSVSGAYTSVNNYREYINQPLGTPMVAGKTYILGMWVRLAHFSKYAVANLHMNLGGSIVSFTNQPITDKNGWTYLTSCFTAPAGISNVEIGNYDLNNSPALNVVDLDPTPSVWNYGSGSGDHDKVSYYYIDDVSIIPLIADAGPDASICPGQSTTLSSSVSCVPAGATVDYSWLPLTGLATPNSSVTLASPLTTTDYTVTATVTYVDPSGQISVCTTTDVVQVAVINNNFTLTATANPNPACLGDIVTLSTNGGNNLTYNWTDGANTFAGYQPTVTANVSTTYTVTTIDPCNNPLTATVSLIVSPSPSFSVSSTTICTGNSATLTVSPNTQLTAINWGYPNPPNPLTIQHQYTFNTAGSYSLYVEGYDSPTGGCQTSTIFPITVQDPTPATLTYTVQPCTMNYTFTASVGCTGGTYTYSFNVNNGSVSTNTTGLFPYTFSTTGIYSVTVSSDYDFFPTTYTINVPPAVTPTISISASPSQTICVGNNVTLTASGGTSYTWTPTGLNTNTITVSPTVTTVYSVTSDCGNVKTITITVNPTPPPITVNSGTICSGQNITLTANNGTNYSWSTGATNTNSIMVAPTSTVLTTVNYTVTGLNSCGVSVSAVATVTVKPLPVFVFTQTSGSVTICPATSYTIRVLPIFPSAFGYVWSTGATATNSIIVAPTTNTIYTVTATNPSTGCSTTKTFSVYMTPVTPIAVSSTTICRNSTATLTASNSTTSYTWSNGANGTNTIAVSPISTTNYTVTGTTACGTSSAVATVTVYALPFIATVGGANNVCAGTNATMTAVPPNPALTYVWSNGFTGNPNIVTATTNSVYTVVATNSLGCSSSKTKTITVLPAPTLSLSLPNTTICVGGSRTFTVTGATNYVWSPAGTLSSSTGSVVTATPSVTTIYTVTGTTSGCSNTKTVSITVIPTVTLSVTATSTNVCIGNSATLTASGALTYSWSTGVTTASIVVTPTAVTNYYYVYGSNGSNCFTAAAILVTGNYPPNITTTASSSTVCAGSSSTLTASSVASSYTWQPGASSANPFVVTPSSTTIYTVTATSGACINTKTISVTVIPNPTVTISASTNSVCLGSSTTLTANGATNYTWSPAGTLSSNSGSVVVASPSVTTVYTVTGQVGNCISTKTIVIGIIPNPSVTVNSPSICVGQSATLTANGANTYSWSTSQTINPITVSPTVTTIYTVTGTNASGCSSSVTSTVTVSTGVIPTFAIVAPNNGNICASGTGSNTPFSTNIPNPSGYTYLWTPGNSTSATPNINITQPVSVKVTVTDAICAVSSVQDICVNYVASICCSNTITTLTNTVITDVAQLPNSTYKVSGTLTFNIANPSQAGLAFKEFLMSTGSKIIVTPITTLELHVCKLYSCEGMWEGIELQSNTTNAAAIDINDGTTIEDAYRAVSANNFSVNVGNNILVNVATFNKNYTDVYLLDWANSGNTYNFESRTGNYTSQSSTTSPGGNLKCSQYYTPTIKARSAAGIYALNTTSVNVGTTGNPFFINSFSNKDYGVIFEKTSGFVTNAKFNNMAGTNGSCPLIGCTPTLPTGVGVFATTNLVTPTTISVTSTPAPVTFTNVECAVYARRVTNLYVLNTVIENPNQSNWNLITSGNGYGYNGIYTEDIKRDLHINYNTIKNAMFGVQATYVNASNVAILSISNNTILTTANNFTTATAINVSSAIGFIGSPSTMPIAANIITNTRNGIQLTGLTGGVTVSGNTINMKTGNAANTTGSAIYLAGGNTNCSIDNNDIFGNSNGLVQNYQLNKIGINVKSSLNCYVQCNRMEKLGTAVRYDGICTSPQTGFFNNGLNAPIRRGLELRNSASMGTQGVYTGVPPAHTVVSTSENQWNGGWNAANTDQTWVYDLGSSALGNRLCVSGGVELPTDNQWNTGFPNTATNAHIYDVALYSLLTSSTAPPVLASCPTKLLIGLKIAGANDSIATVERDEEYKRIITQNLTDPTITIESKWQLKDFMYRNLANGSAPMDATVQSFYSAEQSGSVNDNRTIDSLILLGDYTQASSINGSVSAALIIEQTAKDYNSLWLQKFSDPDYIATSADILTLDNIANQCIHKGGKSVAHARALLGAIYNHPFDYDDDCMDDKVGNRLAQNASHFETKGNTINLFPNPNNGNFTLNYYLTKDVTEADVIVEDVTGKLIYQSTIDVNMESMNLHLTDAKTGIYFVKVMNGKEIISVHKVIITN
jgi:hypothetical protein